jgi:diguanylate cyclase (GGDEF)-like protein
MSESKVIKRCYYSLRIFAIVGSIVLISISVLKPEKKVNVFPNMPAKPAIFTDSIDAVNQSEVSWLNEEKTHFRCAIKAQYARRVCGAEYTFQHANPVPDNPRNDFHANSTSIDLSDYEGLRLSITYNNPGGAPTDQINFNMRMLAADQSEVRRMNSQKIAGAYIKASEFTGVIDVKFEDISVADWWISSNNKTRDERRLQLDKLVQIGILLTSRAPIGIHEFKINNIEAYGQWVSAEKLYLSIISLWIVTIILEGLMRLVNMSYRYKQEQDTLKKLNSKYEDVKEQSHRDQLTGAYNRRGLAKITKHLERESNDLKFGVLVIDLDHFKKINDTIGHSGGDRVLVLVSELMINTLRSQDTFARWGGEEFVVIAQYQKQEELHALGERLRTLISKSKMELNDGKNVSVSVSIGITRVRTNESFNVAFERSDEALYEAKNSGRNCCVYRN